MTCQDQWKEIENLRATKCDYEQLQDGLHDKVDISALNGMINQEQYDACILQIYDKMAAVYRKFDAQEIEWQVSS